MKNLCHLTVLFALPFLGWSGAAHAACSASFLGNCTWGGASTANCSFSTIHDCGNAISSGFLFDFGDGSTSTSGGPTHTYVNPASAAAYQASFTLTCTDNCQVTVYRYVCFTIGTYGCINPDIGWN